MSASVATRRIAGGGGRANPYINGVPVALSWLARRHVRTPRRLAAGSHRHGRYFAPWGRLLSPFGHDHGSPRRVEYGGIGGCLMAIWCGPAGMNRFREFHRSQYLNRQNSKKATKAGQKSQLALIRLLLNSCDRVCHHHLVPIAYAIRRDGTMRNPIRDEIGETYVSLRTWPNILERAPRPATDTLNRSPGFIVGVSLFRNGNNPLAAGAARCSRTL